MSDYGTVQVGRVTLREDRDISSSVNSQTGNISLKLTGQQSFPGPWTSEQVEQQGNDIRSSYGMMVPVVFTQKTNLNGFYSVDDWEVDQSKYVADGANLVPWSATLDKVGSDVEVDFESRLGGSQTHSNSYTVSSGERWHCPPGGTYGYFAGSSNPTILTRTGADGALKVYRGIALGTYPHWGCTAAGYALGRCRFLNNSLERSGILISPSVTQWEINNSLVRVKPLSSGGALEISAYTGGAWQAKSYDVQVNGGTVAPWTSCTVIYNDYNRVTIRLLKTSDLFYRATLDITLRRGSRFVELYLQCATSTTMKIMRATAEAGTRAANSTYIRANAADTAGNKYVVASAGAYTADLANGGMSNTTVTKMDAMVGVEISAAPTGETAADLYNQYLGAPSEMLTVVRR